MADGKARPVRPEVLRGAGTDEVGLAEHADQRPGPVDDGQSADAVQVEQAGRIVEARVRLDHDRLEGHEVADGGDRGGVAHRAAPASSLVSSGAGAPVDSSAPVTSTRLS